MITVVCANPCIDRTVLVDGFTVGGTNHALSVRDDVGGKGINVCSALAGLEVESACLFLEYEDGGAVSGFLNQKGVLLRSVPCGKRLRTNLKLTDPKGKMTEFNEYGAPVEAEIAEAFTDLIRAQLADSDLLVLSGSLPQGLGDGFYARLTEIARRQHLRVIVDAAGAPLAEAIKARPTLIKPNKSEFERLVGYSLDDREQIVAAARKLTEDGPEYVCISLGGDGALLCGHGKGWFCGCPEVTVRGLAGAGDSMVAGFSAAFTQNLDPAESLRRAVAASQASVIRPGTELCTRADYEKMLPLITVAQV